MPIYISYAYSIIIFNVIGSYFVFYPEKSIALVRKTFLTSSDFESTFFYILLLQVSSFFLFLPMHMNSVYSIKGKSFFSNKIFYQYLFPLFTISFLIIFFFLLQNGIPPFFKVGFGELANSLIISERADFFQNISNFSLYSFGFYFIPSLLTVLLFLNYKISNTNYNKRIFLIYFLFAAILSLSFLHKTPLIFLITQVFLASIIFDQKVNITRIIYFSIGSLIFLFFLYLLSFLGEYYIYSYNFIFKTLFESIAQRLFIIYPLSLSVVPELVDSIGFLDGKAGVINPFGLFDIEQFNLQKELHVLLYGFPGNNPPPATGYAYANFGFMGIFWLIFAINILIYIYQSLCNLISNQSISIFVTIFFIIKALSLSMTTIWDNLLMPLELVYLLTCLTIYYFISKGKSVL
jgi:hypothetical protein